MHKESTKTSLFQILMTIERYTGGIYHSKATLNFYEADGSYVGTISYSESTRLQPTWFDRLAIVKQVAMDAVNIYFVNK